MRLRFLLRALLAAALASGLVPPAPAAAAPTDLPPLLDRLVSGFSAGVGVVVLDPVAKTTIYAHAENEVVISASLYKLGVLLEAERRVDAKELSYSDRIEIEPEDITDDGSYEPAGAELTLDEALEKMITISDNGTALALTRILDPGQINATLVRNGVTPFHVRMTEDEDNEASPRAVAKFFELLARKELVSTAASERMLARLERQQLNDRLPAQLPPGTVVAHKTGNLAFVTHDAGIIYGRTGLPLVVVVMTWNGDVSESVELIQDIGSLVYANAFAAPTSVGFVLPRQPVAADAGRSLLQGVRVTNLSNVNWSARDSDPFTLAWEMRDSFTVVVARNLSPIALGNVGAHSSIDLPLVFPVPQGPGEYKIGVGLANRALGQLSAYGVATDSFTIRAHLPFLVAFDVNLSPVLHRDEASLMLVAIRPLPALVNQRDLVIAWRMLDPRNARVVARGTVPVGTAKANDTVSSYALFLAPNLRGTYNLELVAEARDTGVVASATQRRGVTVAGRRTFGDEVPEGRRPAITPIRSLPPVPAPSVTLPPLPIPQGKTPRPTR